MVAKSMVMQTDFSTPEIDHVDAKAANIDLNEKHSSVLNVILRTSNMTSERQILSSRVYRAFFIRLFAAPSLR